MIAFELCQPVPLTADDIYNGKIASDSTLVFAQLSPAKVRHATRVSEETEQNDKPLALTLHSAEMPECQSFDQIHHQTVDIYKLWMFYGVSDTSLNFQMNIQFARFISVSSLPI